MSDRFGKEYGVGDTPYKEYLSRLKDDYQRAYYTGILYERRAKVTLAKGGLNAYELFTQAMEWFEKAEELRPAGVDDPILRWNGCARMIMRNKLKPMEVAANDFIE
ncbi:MAG: hypothetical protein H0V76_11420 [Blastocatellia bacterium]|nr:hypothetical protein [Blastocatellia bacterium]